MSDPINPIPQIIDTMSGGIISHIVTKARNSAQYQIIESRLNKTGYSSEVNTLLERAYNVAIVKVKDEINPSYIQENLDQNKEIIFSWIIHSEDTGFNSEEDKLDILYSDFKSIILRFFKLFYYQIMLNKDDYPLIVALQIKNATKQMLKKQDTILDVQNTMSNQMGVMMSMLEKNFKQTDSSWDFAPLLNKIEEKLNNRKTTEAIDLALSIESEILKSPQNDEIEKFYQLLVNSHILDMNNQDKAEPYLKKLISYTSNKEKKLQRKILLLLIQKDFDSAQDEINKTIDYDFKNDEIRKKIYELQINIFFSKNDYQKALEYLKMIEDYYEDSLIWMSKIYILTQQYENLWTLFNDNLEFFEDSGFRIRQVKFEILITYYMNEVKLNRDLVKMTQNLEQLVLESDSLIAECGNDTYSKCTLICQKAFLLGYLDKKVECEIEYIKAEQISPKNPLFLRNYPILLLNSGEFEKEKKGLNYLKEYIELFPDDFLAYDLYYDHLIRNNPQVAIQELEAIQQDLHIPAFIRCKIIIALDENYNIEEATRKLSYYIEHYPDDCFIQFTQAFHDLKCNKYNDAAGLFETSIKNALPEPFKLKAIIETVKIYLYKNSEDNTKKAYDLLNLHYSKDFFIYNFSDYYIECLFRLKYYIKCIKFCKRVMKLEPKHTKTHRYLANCYMETQNFKLALDQYQILKENGTFNNSDLYNYASCNLSLGQSEEAEKILLYIDPPKSSLDYLNISKFYFLIDKKIDSLNTVHSGIQNHPENRALMEHFISLVLQHNVTSDDPDIRKNFQECLKKYESLPIENKMIKSFKLPEIITRESFEKAVNDALGPVDETSGRTNLDLFNNIYQKKLPLSMITPLDVKNYIFLWQQYTVSNNYYFYNIHGNEKDIHEYKYIETNDIFIDITSLLTLHSINLLDELENNFRTIYVTQSIFDEFQNCILDKSNKFLSPTYIDFTDNKENDYKYHSEHFYENAWDTAQQIITKIKSSDRFVIIGLPIIDDKVLPLGLKNLGLEAKEKFDYDCLITSFSMNIPILYSNNLIRELLNTIENSPGAFGIIVFLQKLYNEKKIDSERFHALISKLIDLNNKYILLTPELLLFNLEQEYYSVKNTPNKTFKLLSDTGYNKNGVINLIIHVLNITFKKEILFQQKVDILRMFIEKLETRGDISKHEIFKLVNHFFEREQSILFKQKIRIILSKYE